MFPLSNCIYYFQNINMLTNRRTSFVSYGLITIMLLYAHVTVADIFDLKGTESVIGQLDTAHAEFNETLLDIGRSKGFGYQDLKLLNPHIDTWLPGEGMEVLLPGQFVLPNVPREGIVLNIPEMRLYYFPEAKPGAPKQVITYPLGVGREGWSTPYIKTRIVEKKKHPAWYPPESIRLEHEEKGDSLPKIVKPGPDNPLGDYAMRLGARDYLIHGTNKPFGVGMRVSHGCIRLYPEDIEDLFQRVSIGTPVNIINQPYKIGELDGVIYLEVHPHLDEDNEHFSQNSLTEVVKYIIETTEENRYEIDWNLVKQIVAESKGIPVAIGVHTLELQATVDKEVSTTTLTREYRKNKVPDGNAIKKEDAN
jgi:L,D-transpeptidase ErfK/SrfK